MQGKKVRGLFMEVGKSVTNPKSHPRKPALSYATAKPSFNQQITHPMTAPGINNVQKTLPTRRKSSLVYPKINRTAALITGTNQDFLYMRKQNHLNTCFNIRKNKLREISKENKQIHDRISSQKSLYSSADLNKSFQSNCEIKKRLSSSKLSQRSGSSHNSSRKNGNSIKDDRFGIKKKNNRMEIKAASINKAEVGDLKDFQNLFGKQTNIRPRQQSLNKLQQKQSITTNSYRRVQGYLRVPKSAAPKTLQSPFQAYKSINDGGLLHRIAEQLMTSNQKPKDKQKKCYLKGPSKANKKMFNF